MEGLEYILTSPQEQIGADSDHFNDQSKDDSPRPRPAEQSENNSSLPKNKFSAHLGLGVVAVCLATTLYFVLTTRNTPDTNPVDETLPSLSDEVTEPEPQAEATSGGSHVLPLPEMVSIEPGDFWMGTDDPGSDEWPRHKVTFAEGFSISATEVTFPQYDAFANATGVELPGDNGWGRGNRPVINVTWQKAQDYAAWLGEQVGQSCRLPTEAEWEYAARAGTETAYALPAPGGGDDIRRKGLANCYGCGSKWDYKKTAPVRSFAPNAWNLYQMHGNVREWVEDCWHTNYKAAPQDGRAWLEEDGGECSRRVLRGGSWLYMPEALRSASRGRYNPVTRNDNVGFRVVCRPH